MAEHLNENTLDLVTLFRRFALRLSKDEYRNFMIGVMSDWVLESGCEEIEFKMSHCSNIGKLQWTAHIKMDEESAQKYLKAEKLFLTQLDEIQIIVEGED